ncbi:MAG TPA: divalent metal cation transporter [Candidatus Saccharimonadales bacterium]|nr:divalent metal cation transporter [Candidatus Saccharimonadales bacterium]
MNKPKPTRPAPPPEPSLLQKEYSADVLLTRGVEMPAVALDKTVQLSNQILHAAPVENSVKKAKGYWYMLGPGLTTGASDDDPSGIATYSQIGAQYGFSMLWFSLWTFPLMSAVQEMCARIGLVTGRGLAGNIRVHYSRKVLRLATLLLFAANAFNIGADLGAMAKGVQLLNPRLNFSWLVVSFALISLLLQIFTPYVRYAKYLKWLALVLLSYVVSSILAHLQWGSALYHTLIPHITFDKDTLLLMTAVLGTTISPYLFFWQTSQEVEEQILQGKTTLRERQSATSPMEVKSMRIDVWSGMLLSNLVMFFIIAACGGILFPHGITHIATAAQAAEALKPFAGNATYFLFAIGIIGTGMLAIPVLAGSSSYAIAESLQWREGLYRGLNQAYAFYGIIILSMLVGLGLNFIGLDPIKALIYSAVANGLVAPFILFFIVKISSNKQVMGHWRNRPLTTFVGWLTTAVMAAAGIAAIISLI